jgi:hypothetical protein
LRTPYEFKVTHYRENNRYTDHQLSVFIGPLHGGLLCKPEQLTIGKTVRGISDGLCQLKSRATYGCLVPENLSLGSPVW